MVKRIYWDPGHGGSDPGAVGNGLKEKDLTLKIVNYAIAYLHENYTGHEQKRSRTGDQTCSLSWRTNDANEWGADVFISVHINAGKGIGYEDYIYNKLGNGSNAGKLQDAIHKEITPLFARDRGQKKANFYVLRNTNMPGVLTENGFIDTISDAEFLKDDSNLKEIGEAHAVGVATYLGLNTIATKKEEELTLSQYNELKKLIDGQSKEIESLKKELAKKANAPKQRHVADSHKDNWEWLTDLGITNGDRPYEHLTREQFATMLKVYDGKRFPTDNNVSVSHEDAWQWAINEGITNGATPRKPLTREQFVTMLKRYSEL